MCFYLYNHRLEQAFVIMFSTFFYYNLCNIIYVKDYSLTLNNSRLSWVSTHLTEIIFASIGAFVIGSFLGIKLLESNQYKIEYLTFIACSFLSTGYFFIRNTPFLKNIVIGLVWVLVLHIWTIWDTSYFNLFIIVYLTLISIWYDKTKDQVKKAIIDSLIPIPFLIKYLAELHI